MLPSGDQREEDSDFGELGPQTTIYQSVPTTDASLLYPNHIRKILRAFAFRPWLDFVAISIWKSPPPASVVITVQS